MRLIRVFRSSTSATKLKFVFCLMLVEGVLCVQTQINGSAKNATEKNGSDSNGSDSNGSDSNGSASNGPVKSTVLNGPERKDASSRSPAPVQESSESEEQKEYIYENTPGHETISPVFEVNQHTTTVSNYNHQDLSESSRENIGFRPSMHLGQIGEINFTGTIHSPFNKVPHIGVEHAESPEANVGSVETHPQLVRQKSVKFYDTDHGYKPEAVKVQPIQLSEYLHNLQNQQNLQSQQQHQNHYAESDYAHRAPNHDTRIVQGVLSLRPMAFDGANYNLGSTERPYQYVNIERPYHVSVEKPYQVENVEKPYHVVNVEKIHPHVNFQKPYHFVNNETPHQTPHNFVFEKPSKLQSEEKFLQPLYNLQSYEHVNPLQFEHFKKPEFEFEHFKKPELHLEHYTKPDYNVEYIKKPEISVEYLQPGIHSSSENVETFGKPQNVVYITTHESILTRTKKYPSPHHSPFFATELPILYENHSQEHESHDKRISPWKKIIHILGAAIPLGLLFAALTPRVVNLDNTTEPNIVLSKLRNLPREHKEGRFTDSHDMCEERAICDLILGGADPKSNFAQSLLWNLSNRITDDVVEKNGLHEIFDALKKKDCSSLTC